MTPIYHSTRDYHLNGLQTLGWELTLCNALYPERSPCRGLLRRNASYGKLLSDFLDRTCPLGEGGRVLEVGGGYGHLMRDFLRLHPGVRAVMLDLSPVLLDRQREALEGFPAEFIQCDFLAVEPSFLAGFDLVILNENLGDFPAVLDIPKRIFEFPLSETGPEGPLGRVLHFFSRYGLERPEADPFHCNLGAWEAVETLCRGGVGRIFLSEHSCEAKVPEPLTPFLKIDAPGNPERICLRGHDEYTLSFSHLRRIAEAFGYRSLRGPLADIVQIEFSPRVQSILRSRLERSDEDEIIRHFVEDLYKYEYLILTKE